MVKDCTTCGNFDIETVYGVCCKYGILSDVKEDCKDYENISNFFEIGKRIEQLLKELERVK